jgi:hypothetical protein
MPEMRGDNRSFMLLGEAINSGEHRIDEFFII